MLKNGLAFKKDIMSTYPAQFTEWVANVDLTPADKPQMKKPIKGKKRWKNLPQLIVIVIIKHFFISLKFIKY
jgi:hypothetical protein